MLPISQKDLYIHETTIGRLLREHSTTTVLEETNQDSQYQGKQPTGRQLKRKYYTSECQKYSNRHPYTQKPRGYYNELFKSLVLAPSY